MYEKRIGKINKTKQHKLSAQNTDFIDKIYQKTINYSTNDWEKVERIEERNLSIIDNLYYITDSPTFIKDNIYLGNAYNASNYDELKQNNR